MRKAAHLLAILLAFVLVFVLLWSGPGSLPAAGGPGPFAIPAPAGSAPSATWQRRVDDWVLSTAQAGDTEFLVFLNEQADLSGAEALKTKQEKGAYVYQQLTETARRTQGPLLAELAGRGAAYRPYWVANMVWVRGSASLVQALAQRADVAHLYANPRVQAQLPAALPVAAPTGPTAPDTVEWNLAKVNAPQVWAQGFTGQGVVIGGQDTGYDWTHPALKGKYRGWNGSAADHNYNWHDAIHENNPHTAAGNPCGFNSLAPCDDYSHGTHTMGILVGDDGAGNQVGMAPGARWIGCRNMEQGWGSPASYSECYQWFIAPTDLNNQNPRSDLAPDVINNSWGCPYDEGCTSPNVLQAAVHSVVAAGILTVHSAGNDGSGCGSVNTPGALYDDSFTVGNTDSNDLLAGSSSRGPVTIDGSGRLKPDISAPGTGVRSSVPGAGYASMTGTSMAGPHVAGLAALLISAQPALKGHPAALRALIEAGAVRRNTSESCGGTAGKIPNNAYGWGRIDAWGAYNAHALEIGSQVSAAQINPGGVLTYTLAVTHTAILTPTAGVVLTDVLPANTAFITATQPFARSGDTFRWNLGSLSANASRQVKLVVSVLPAASGTISNTGLTASSAEVALVSGKGLRTSVVPYSLRVRKSGPVWVLPGGLITYTLLVTNPHPVASTFNIVLSDSLPAHTSFITATQPFTHSGAVVQWIIPSLAPQATSRQQLTVRVSAGISGTVVNQFYAARSQEVPAPASGTPVAVTILNGEQTYFVNLPSIERRGSTP